MSLNFAFVLVYIKVIHEWIVLIKSKQIFQDHTEIAIISSDVPSCIGCINFYCMIQGFDNY